MRIAVAACLCFGTVSAQEQLRVRPAEVQQEDVVAALGALGVDVLRFDFSDFTRENYDVAVYLDEADSTGTERLYTVHAGGTRQQLTRMSEEVRMGFRTELHLPETTTEYVRGRSLTLIFSQKNDSTKLLTVHIPGMMRFSLPLELRDSGAGGEPRYFYSLRPFKLSAVEAGSEEIPLAFYSSGWYDPKAGVVRSCGVSEIDPALTDELVGLSPHYYVVGVIFEKKE